MGKFLWVKFGARLQPRCRLLPTVATISSGELLEMLVLGPLCRMYGSDSDGEVQKSEF